MHKVSIIVPVHNSSATLNKCVDSILNQTYHNLEVILIENGSEDSSLQMCEEYAKKDSRVRVLSLQTSGISKARNAGLDCMTGDYFTCVDSDDFIELDMIEKLLAEAEKSQADMTFCRIRNFKSNGEVFVSEERRLEDVVLHREIQYLFFVETDDYVRNVMWRILYKSSAFDGQRFHEDMMYAEDAEFLFRTLTISKKNSLVAEPLYNYTYFYDIPEHTFNKYFKEAESIIKTIKHLAISSYNLCKNFHMDAFADAVIYSKYMRAVTILLQHTDYKKKMGLIYKDEFWREIDTKSRYKAYKKYFSSQSKIKAYLIRHKMFGLYKILAKTKKRLHRK